MRFTSFEKLRGLIAGLALVSLGAFAGQAHADTQLVEVCGLDDEQLDRLQSQGFYFIEASHHPDNVCALFESPSSVEDLRESLNKGASANKEAKVMRSFVVPDRTARAERVRRSHNVNRFGENGENNEPADESEDGVSTADQGHGYEIYDDFDAPVSDDGDPRNDGVRAQMYALAAAHPDVLSLEVMGHSHQGREIIALNLTDHSLETRPDGSEKGSVLFVAMHHAREWVTVEHAMRFLYWAVEHKDSDPELRRWLQNTKIWVMPVMNPDGYQHTFDTHRMWRKNLRDNDNNGVIDREDGVDLNRNYDYLWGYDDWGSSSNPGSGVYRGPQPASEPETQALKNLILRERPTYGISYHSYGNLILYPNGYKGFAKTADDPMFKHLAGTPDRAAIYDRLMGENYYPTVSSGLYTTNGEFTDWAYNEGRVIAYTVELTDYGQGFVFPDEESKLQMLFEDNLPFMKDLIRSSMAPAKPVSHLNGEFRPYAHNPIRKSFGSTQEIEVSAPKGAVVDLKYRRRLGDEERNGRFQIQDKGVYLDTLVARVRRAEVGDEIKYRVHVREGDVESMHPSGGFYVYEVAGTSGNSMLLVDGSNLGGQVLEAEDPRSFMARTYLEALETTEAAGDFDLLVQNDNEDLPFLDVLSHYETVIWFTGDNEASISVDQARELAHFVERGGKLFLTGETAGASLFDHTRDATASNFFAYTLGVGRFSKGFGMIGSSPDQLPNLDGVAEDPVFGGMSLALRPGSQTRISVAQPEFEGVATGTVTLRPPLSAGTETMTYSSVGHKFVVPEDNPAATLQSMFSVWGAFYFFEVLDVERDEWTAIVPEGIEPGSWQPALSQESCTAYLDANPELQRWLERGDCSFQLNLAGEPLMGGALPYQGALTDYEFDLTAFAGREIELRLTHFTLEQVWGGRAFVTGFKIGGDAVDVSGLSFVGDWNDDVEPMDASVSVRTDNTFYMGFGFEAIQSSQERSTVMQRVLEYLTR